MSKKNTPALIIFDIDGTLYELKGALPGSSQSSLPFFKEVSERAVNLLANRLSVGTDKAIIILKELSLKHSGQTSIGLEKDYSIGREEYFNYAWDIRAENYVEQDSSMQGLFTNLNCKKAALTTSPPIWCNRVINRLGLEGCFDGIWNGFGDIRKPDVRAYIQVTDFFGIEKNRVLMIEDQEKNLVPAKSLGFQTLLIGKPYSSAVDNAVRNIIEMKKYLKELFKVKDEF